MKSLVVTEQPRTVPTDIYNIFLELAKGGHIPNKKTVEFYLSQGSVISKSVKANRLKGIKKISLPFTNAAGHRDFHTLLINSETPAGELALTKNRMFAVMHITNYLLKFGITSALAARVNWDAMEEDMRDIFRPLSGAGFQFIGKYLQEHVASTMIHAKKSEIMFINTQEYAKFVGSVDFLDWLARGHEYKALAVEFHSVADGCTRNLGITAAPAFMAAVSEDRATALLRTIAILDSGVIVERRGVLGKRIRDVARAIIAARDIPID
ncbi:hypothetical protein U1Q18_050544 [Sarracenia purpurea var. burkii]